MLRKVAAISVGIIVAMLIVLLLEWVGQRISPVPVQVDPANPDLAKVPLPAMIAMLVAWFFGPLGGGIIANRLARANWPCWVIAALIICGALYEFAIVRHPIWMIAGGIAAPLLAGWIASRFAPQTG